MMLPQETKELLEPPPLNLFRLPEPPRIRTWAWLAFSLPFLSFSVLWPFIMLGIDDKQGGINASKSSIFNGILYYWALQIPSLGVALSVAFALRDRARLNLHVVCIALGLGVLAGLLCHMVQVFSTFIAMSIKGYRAEWYWILIDPDSGLASAPFITFLIVTFFVESITWITALTLAFFGERYIRKSTIESNIDQRLLYLGVMGASTMFTQSAFWYRSVIGHVALGPVTPGDLAVTFFAENMIWVTAYILTFLLTVVAITPQKELHKKNKFIRLLRKIWIPCILIFVFEAIASGYAALSSISPPFWQKALTQLSPAVPLIGFLVLFFVLRRKVFASFAMTAAYPARLRIASSGDDAQLHSVF